TLIGQGGAPPATLIEGDNVDTSTIIVPHPTSTLTLRNLQVSGGEDSGILNLGTLALDEVVVSNNTTESEGGGIANYGTLSVQDSTITGNTATIAGGGILSGPDAITTISGTTTITRNDAAFGGG